MAEAAPDTNTPEVKVEPTAIEQEAVTHGWRPKEEFVEAPGKKWRSAEEFMDRKPLYDKLEEQSRKIKQLDQGLKSLADHNAGIEKAAYQRALTDLNAQKKAALADGNLLAVEEIRDKIEDLKQAAPQPKQAQQEPAEYESW